MPISDTTASENDLRNMSIDQRNATLDAIARESWWDSLAEDRAEAWD